MALKRSDVSIEMWWLERYVVAQERCGDAVEMWLLKIDVLTQ